MHKFPLARTIAGLICLAAAMLIYIGLLVLPALEAPGYDLAPLAAAGRLVATDRTAHLYDHDPRHHNRTSSTAFDAAVRDVGFEFGSTPFVYPPLVAAAMQPVSEVPFPTFMWWWTVGSAVSIIVALWLCFRLYLPAALTLPVFAAATLALCFFEPVSYGLWLGQTTAAIFVLVLGALAFQRRRQFAVAGLLLAIAAFVKLTPSVLALVWLWRGPRRAFAWFAGASAGLWGISIATLGLEVHLEYLTRIREIGGTVPVAYNNHSLLAFLTRRHVDEDAIRYWQPHASSAGDQALLVVFVGLLLVATLIVVGRIPRESDERWRAVAEGLAFSAILLVPSISWTHYFVMLLPVMAVILAHGSGATRPIVYAASAAIFLLCSSPVMPDQLEFDPSSRQLVAGPTAAALLAIGVLFWLTSRQRLSVRSASG
jgi:alpha-1,2-mannosyltransferase